jgi:hypothetical protein
VSLLGSILAYQRELVACIIGGAAFGLCMWAAQPLFRKCTRDKARLIAFNGTAGAVPALLSGLGWGSIMAVWGIMQRSAARGLPMQYSDAVLVLLLVLISFIAMALISCIAITRFSKHLSRLET